MTPPVGVHPSAETLQAFGLGKLDQFAAQAVIEHLASCPACSRAAAAQSSDDFLARLRDAQRPGTTPMPLELAGVQPHKPSTLPTQPAPVLRNLLPELAANAQYEVLRELGRGGMGVVYLARNRLLQRLEVLKVVNQDLLARAGGKERFLREIQAAAKLNHPNVVTAYSAMQLGELLVFAMEYVEGDDLAKVVKARGPLPMVHACYYVQQAALGLQHACDKQMVHRDIKPQNLILARAGKKHMVKILDFGLAKIAREKGAEPGLTGAGKILGTPDYIAPEQTLDAAAADIRADIYSLGCTFYYLLTGDPPFKGNTLYAVLQAHHTQTATPVNVVRPDVPAAVTAVVGKMMAKEPAARYQRPAEVAQALAPIVKAGAKALASGPILMAAPAGRAEQTQPRIGQQTMVTAALPPETMAPQPAPVLAARAAVGRRLPARGRPIKVWILTITVAVAVFLLASVAGYWLASLFKKPTSSPAPNTSQETPAQRMPVARERVTDWGEPVDPDHDCTFALENGQLHMGVPGTYHDLSTELGTLNAPRVLHEVEGDFSAEVVVLGSQPAETRGISKRRLPFQGAGLVIWQDDKNYIRLERGLAYTRSGIWLCYPNWEARRQGQYVRHGILNEGVLHEDKPVSLRVVRRGDVFSGFYRQEGDAWKELPALNMDFAKKLRVGVCAIQNTAAPYEAVFEELKISPAK